MRFGKTGRLLAMLGVTTSFFLVELIVGYLTHSMALVADSFHMLSDVMALLVAFLSVRISKRTSTKNTFGWARAEVLGALVNSVFLIALCFSIFVEAIQRFHENEGISNPKLVLIVGCIGLAVNLVGLLLFHQHTGGDGHGHGHGHGGHSPSHDHSKDAKKKEKKASDDVPESEHALMARQDGTSATANGHVHAAEDQEGSDELPEPRIASSSQLNMRGVFLHVLGDALGSCVVIISALIIWFTDWEYENYIDPAMSILMVMIISYTTIPLLRESALILMQTVPTHIEIEEIKSHLLKIEGVHAVHELHIWQLAGDRIIASAHIRCHNLQEYMEVAVKVKQFFHNEGIHSTTIQPEFEENPLEAAGTSAISQLNTMSNCIIPCPPDLAKNCSTSVCCRPTANGKVVVVTNTNNPTVSLDQNVRALEQVLTPGSRRTSRNMEEVSPPPYNAVALSKTEDTVVPREL
ncbi:hypothetical protein RvY_07164 [Ramazzottius varieornatus]|uniref:Uncharacterized protein n=1 Tax=Ramazzottius varieornatus TaxID=947166 RepID=A0A1D1V4D0_RAMVA|nr:hypothetical protein RvY_07164 [Ramazzottius varieornatus]